MNGDSRSGMSAVLRAAAAWLALAIAGNSNAEELLLQGATVHTVSGETFERADVLVRDGEIAAVGPSLNAPGAAVVDLKGLRLYPGLIAATSSLGLIEIGAVRATDDTREVGDFTPDVEAWIAVNPDSELIPVARASGIAHALTLPLGGRVSGLSGVISLHGWTWEEMTVRAPAALHLWWPPADLRLEERRRRRRREAPPGQEEERSPEKQAEERRRLEKELDDFFEEARVYEKARAAGAIPDARSIPAWEAMRPAVRGEIPIFVHADDERQIRAACEWAERRGWRNLAIAGGRDADRCADLLASLRIPVVYERVFDQPARDTEDLNVHFAAPGKLHAAGVKVSLSLGAGSWGAAGARNLPHQAAQAAAHGLPADEAVRSITLNPARLLGLGDRLGSIEVGKEATLIAVDGDLLDVRSNVKLMWIAGRPASLESRHTRLYRRYKERPAGK